MDPDALKVLYRLEQSGYTAYLVGGGVRDLLLGRKPKDFDISTNAHPQEIRRLFRNAVLIGRRFRLVHVRFGSKVIETSTFRREPERQPGGDDESLYQHRDNTFGTPEEDARRRDFTVNALFYDISTFSIIDHVGGLADLERRRIRCIGDPNVRFREDPVRMLRAVRFAARLGFDIDPETYEGILRHHAEIAMASPARLSEEVLRLFAFGAGEKSFRLLRSTGLLRDLFPELDEWLDRNWELHSHFWAMLAELDKLNVDGVVAHPDLAFAVLYCPGFMNALTFDNRGEDVDGYKLASDIIHPASQRLHLPKRISYGAAHLLAAQPRMAEAPRRAWARRFAMHETFETCLKLRRMYCDVYGVGQSELDEWAQLGDSIPTSGRPDQDGEGGLHPRRRRRRRRGPRRPQGEVQAGGSDGTT